MLDMLSGVVRGVATANNNDNKLGNRSDGWGYDYRGLVENNGSDLGGSFASYTSGDIIGIYADLDNNELYFSKNGTFQNRVVTQHQVHRELVQYQ
jgi:hypothetical protein